MGKEPRMVQIVDLEINNLQQLRIINYHGIWSKDKQGTEETRSVSQKLLKFSEQVTYPMIICGDLNLFPDSESVKILNKAFTSLVDKYKITRTRPKSNELSSAKRNVVDYIFISQGIKETNIKVIDSDVSDHFPLLLEFYYPN